MRQEILRMRICHIPTSCHLVFCGQYPTLQELNCGFVKLSMCCACVNESFLRKHVSTYMTSSPSSSSSWLSLHQCQLKFYLPFFTFVGPCIVIHFYSKTNQMHNISNLFYFGKLYTFRTVPSSIIRSLIPYIQHQVYVIQAVWLLAPDDGQKDRPKHVECCSKIK